MKKFITISSGVLAALVFIVSCNKVDKDSPKENNQDITPATELITISARLSDALTKVSFDADYDSNSKPTGMAHTWQEGDMLRITDASNNTNTQVYELVDGAGTSTGVFRGEAIEAESYNVEAVPVGTFSTGNSQTQAADGSTDHLQFVASATGVTDLNSIELAETSNIIGIIAKLPAGAAATINELEIETSTDDFATSTKLNVTISTPGDTDSDDILKVYANVPASWGIPAGSKMFLRFKSTNTSHTVYTRYQEFASAASINPGQFNYIKLNCSNIDKYAGGSDYGTSTAPYLIADKYQMQSMRSLMPVDVITYFKMIDDVDLDNEAWEPLNYDNNFKRGIFFDGQNHTISNLTTGNFGYPSFVGVLNGTIKDITIDGVTIDAGNNKAGAVGGYIGTSGIVGHCSGVTVQDVNISGTNYIGGFCGQVGNAGDTFEDCHVLGDNTITQNFATDNTERSTGGFAGHASTAASYTNCTVKATVSQGVGKTINALGGFIGKADGGVSTFTDCHVLEGSSVSGHSNVGGFVGYNTRASSFNNCTTIANVTGDGENLGGFVGNATGGLFGSTDPCVAFGTVTGSSSASYYIGGFVGLSSATSYNGCSYQGTAVTSNASTSGKNALAGGFCGRSAGVEADSFIDCFVYNSTSGTIVTATLQRIGGFIGQSGSGNSTNLGTFTGCYVKNVTVQPGDKNSGGFVGVAYVPITNCYVEEGSIKAAGVSTGGFAGHVEKVDITGCYSTMTIDGNGKSDVGGLIGYVASALTISNCYYSGNLNANGQAHGGIVGHTGNVAAIIQNCYSSGNLTTTAGVQIHGGIVGELGTGGKVLNCYSTMTITGGRVLGGIVGRAASGGWNYESETNNTVSGCIAFNPSISASQVGTYGSSGAIVGVTSIKNILENSYRIHNMTFVNSNEWGNNMVDQVNSDGTNWTRDTAMGTGTGNQCAYFGKAAASDATVSSVAQFIGWSSDVWDFSGELPTLK